MKENLRRNFEVSFNLLAVLGAIIAFFVGLSQFKSQGQREMDLEIKKTFWSAQNELYIDICNNAGAMAATIADSAQFEQHKVKFLSQFYGQIALVTDSAVEAAIVGIRDYVSDVNLHDPNNQISFKYRVLELADACKRSSTIFKSEIKR